MTIGNTVRMEVTTETEEKVGEVEAEEKGGEPEDDDKTEEDKTEEEEKLKENEKLTLFAATGVRKQEYWQCIRYIAPSNEDKKWTSMDAIGTFCTTCKIKIKYDAYKNNKGVKRHMEKFHPKVLEEFKRKKPKASERESSKKRKIDSFFPTKQKIAKQTASAPNQKQFNKLVALWTALSLRPFSISEDAKLQEVIQFAANVEGQITMPSRNSNKTNIISEANDLKLAIRKELYSSCLYYSCSSDMWSSRHLKAFMALTLHFLTDAFNMRSYTLEIKPTLGKHTGDMIRGEIVESFKKWNLDITRLTMMLRDSGSNMVKACNDMEIRHFPCIGHSLHLVVGPFLVVPKNKSKEDSLDEEQFGDNEQEDDNEDDCFIDSFDKALTDDVLVSDIRKFVQDMQKLTVFIKNSTKCIEKIDVLQKELFPDNPVLKVKMDVRTRWNSTLDMMQRLIKLQRPIDEFLLYYNSAAGKKEFKGIKTKLPWISDEKWAILHGLCYLLSSFGKATEILSGEQYSTFVSAMPVLRKIKHYISDPELFKFDSPNLSKTKQAFFDTYGSMPFFTNVTNKLDTCRKLLLFEFNSRFTGLDPSVLWASLLDPRFGLLSTHWKDDEEKECATKLLIAEVFELTKGEDVDTAEECFSDSEKSAADEDFSFDFAAASSAAQATTNNDVENRLERTKIHVTHEVQSYLLGIQSLHNPKPLKWWSVNNTKYPLVAKAARKWLSVPATSTPSERVFSICGIVDTAKRTRLLGESVEAQVFLHNNYNNCCHKP